MSGPGLRGGRRGGQLGYRPQDDAEEFAAQVEEAPGRAPSRPADRFQGGSFVEEEPGR